MILVIQLFAIIVAVCGTWLLQTAWRKPQRHWGLVLSSWGLICFSFYIWTFTTAADKGVALGLVAWVLVALAALTAIVFSAPVRTERRLKKTQNRLDPLLKTVAFKRFLSALLIGPVAGIVALVLSVLMFQLMLIIDVEYTANLAIALMLFPIFWGGLAVLLGYQLTLIKRLITLVAIGAGSAIGLFLAS